LDGADDAFERSPSYLLILLDKKPDRCAIRESVGAASRAVLCSPMASFLSTILLPVAVAAVALVLLLGLLNMMRGGSPNRSQKLMRMRVLLQFVAIVITMLAVWAMGH
jgi:hypothetical protein